MINQFAPREGWIKPGFPVAIQGMNIRGGCFYVGQRLPNQNEKKDPCRIDLSLPILPNTCTPIALDEPPAWDAWDPKRRGAFLAWLATDRTQPDIPDDFLELYLYGFERRLLVDACQSPLDPTERSGILDELHRLQIHYASRKTFLESLQKLCAMASALSNQSIPPETFLSQPQTYRFLIPYLLAARTQAQQKISPELAWLWFAECPNARAPYPTNTEFKRRFLRVFQQQYPNGFDAYSDQNPLKITYRACNPALGALVFDFPKTSDVFQLPQNVQRLQAIAKQALECLQNGTTDPLKTQDNPFAALLKLPAEDRRTNESLRNVARLLSASAPHKKGSVKVRDLFHALNEPAPKTLSPAVVDDIGTLIELSCYTYAPCARLHNARFHSDDTLYIAEALLPPQPSQAMRLMALILRLSAIIAQADKKNDPKEIQILVDTIKNRKILSNDQRTSLLLFANWCIHTPQSLDDCIPEMRALSEPMCQQISQILISVAKADGTLDPRERTALVDIHRAMKLPATWVDLAFGLGDQDFLQIPKCEPNKIANPQVDCLANREKNNSKQAIDISFDLSRALSDICEPQKRAIHEDFGTQNAPFPSNQDAQNALLSLDHAHQSFLKTLARKNTWPRLEVFKIAIQQQLMADRAIQKINQTANTTLIQDGDSVTIHTDACAAWIRQLQATPNASEKT